MAFKPALRSSMRLKPAAVLAVLMAIQTCLTAQVSSPLLHGLLVLGATGRSLSPAATRRGPALARRDVHFHQRLQGGARLGVPPLRVVLRRIGSEGTVPVSID